jgi:phosphatidyl-myo-inositol dimannoside synthase
MKRKILSLTSDRGLGGISASLVSYSKAMALEDIEHIVCMPKNSPVYAELKDMGNVNVISKHPTYLRWHSFTGFRIAKHLRQLMSEADLILVHNAKHAKLPSQFKSKTFVVNHNGKTRFLDKAPNIIFLNKTIRRQFFETFPELTTHNQIIGHGFEIGDKVVRTNDTTRPVRIISAGRLIEKKGYRDLIETACLLQQKQINCHISIYGEGKDEAYLKERISELSLDNISIHPWTSDLRAKMAEADIFCTPSHGESFALVIGEALEAGLAIASTRTNGALGFFSLASKTDPIGFMSDIHDTQGMAGNLMELVSDGELRTRMQENARRLLLENFTLAKLGVKFKELCRDAAKRPRIFMPTQTFPPRIGGMENVMFSLARKLSAQGHFVSVLPNKRFKTVASFDIVNFGLAKPLRILAKRLYLALSLTSDDVVICDSWKSTNVVPKRFKGHLVILAHGQEYFKTGKRAIEIQDAINRCHKLIASSEFTANLALRNFQIEEAKVSVIPPTYMLKAPRENEKTRKQQNITRFVSVCRLEKRKGLMNFLQTCTEPNIQKQNWHWDIIGNGPEAYFLRKEIAKLKLEDRVVLHHNVGEQQKHEFLRQADIFVMPSYQEANSIEGFGISFAEAASFGLPSIAGLDGGSPEAVQHGVTGWCVDPLNGEELTATIEEVLNSPEESARRGLAAADLFKNKMSGEQTFALFVEKAINSR